MDVIDAIGRRRSIRRYSSRPVEAALFEQVLEAARWAPSGGNRQPWRFILVDDPATVELIRSVSPGALFKAPAYIMICYVPAESGAAGAGESERMADCYIAAENIALAAHALGLGTCMIRSFSVEATREVLAVPPEARPVLMLSIGYAAETPKAPDRRALRDLAYRNEYGRNWQS